MGPILDCGNDASQTGLVLLGSLTSSQLLFPLIVKTELWGNSQNRHSRVILLQDGEQKMDEYPSGKYNKIRK